MKQRLERLSFLVFYAVALTISGWFLVTKLSQVADEQEGQRLAALDDVRGELSQSLVAAQSLVELLQLTMENELAVRDQTAPPSRLLKALREDEEGDFNLDVLPTGLNHLDVGNLTGLGGTKNREPDFLTEVEVALSLRSVFAEILIELPNVPWTYYVSARRFSHVYPWKASSEFAFEDKDFEQEYYIRGAPELNPNRLPYVTPVYDDDAGEGLMITVGRPVYSSNRFMGIVALDFTLSYIDDVLEKFPKTYGEIYLIDASQRVISYSNRAKSTDQINLPEALAASPLLAPDHIGDAAQTDKVGNDLVAAQGISGFPFALVTIMPKSGIYQQVLRGAELEIATFLGVLALLAFIEWRRRINDALAKAKEEAEEATKAKSSFLAMMSHEIRTPMNGVMSMAEMLDQTELSEDQRSMSAVIRSSATALLTIINDILDFSKIEAGKLDVEATAFSIVEAVESAGELVCQRAEDKGIALTIVVDPKVPEILTGDPTRIRQILINLIGNGVKFTEAGGVTVRVISRPQDVVRFEVNDTGIGLTQEQCGRLFKAFAQADVSTSRKYGGTGLGLSISQRLCELMGGRIGVQSVAGEGSTFWFELPLKRCDEESSSGADVHDARVIAVGFHGATRESFDAIMAVLGIRDVTHLLYEDEVVRKVSSPADIIFLSAQGGDPRALIVGQEINAQPAPRPTVLAAPRSLGSTLSESERAGFLASITLPLRRARMRQVIAAALGRGSLTERVAATDGNFDPPSIGEAREVCAVVLVAEDNTTNQVVIKRMLGKLGYALEMANNGYDALQKYEPTVHGLLLTDFHMPEMDGFELTAEIRRREAGGTHRLPIVALTADALPGTEQRCLDSGMDGYLTKPIDSKLLAETLERWLPAAATLRRVPKPEAKPSGSDITIDPLIFNSVRLKESFGSFGPEARDFLAGFIADAHGMAAAVTKAMEASDWKDARHHAHALKGAALSLGAVRLGELAGEVQDYLDQDDPETASLFAGGLVTTVDELAGAVSPLLAKV